MLQKIPGLMFDLFILVEYIFILLSRDILTVNLNADSILKKGTRRL